MLDKQREILNKLLGFCTESYYYTTRKNLLYFPLKKKKTGKEINLLIHVTEILGQREADEWVCEVRS